MRRGAALPRRRVARRRAHREGHDAHALLGSRDAERASTSSTRTGASSTARRCAAASSRSRVRFPTTLYGWRVQVSPERERRAHGARAEPRDARARDGRALVRRHRARRGDDPPGGRARAAHLGAEERLRRQREPRAQDAPGARAHVRRDAPDRPRRERGEAPGVPRHHRRARASGSRRSSRTCSTSRASRRDGRPTTSPTATSARPSRKAVNVYRYRAEREGVELATEVEPDLPRVAHRRPRHPARGHQPHRQRPQVRARLEGRHGAGRAATNGGIVVRVDDQGPGVPPEDRERIFERFVRGSTARVRGRSAPSAAAASASRW